MEINGIPFEFHLNAKPDGDITWLELYTTLPSEEDSQVKVSYDEVRIRIIDEDGYDDWTCITYFTHEDIIHIADCMDYVQKEKDKHYASLTKKEN